jgi:hypothetical protein
MDDDAAISKRESQIQAELEDVRAKYRDLSERLIAGDDAAQAELLLINRRKSDLERALHELRNTRPSALEDHGVAVMYGPPSSFRNRNTTPPVDPPRGWLARLMRLFGRR